ncbi:proline-rich receptor-like protein kinase PERK12 [Lathyrus oleraceus]|uniref:proline-rich receptor-like protein kinase PERK12 n=1 Tax=Pisum sativum TaxID=3888 RepID=UPI0021D0A16A|nr:proline-rich receptor-like protein kinase PERK12 [Pisum sativum]
MKRKREPSKKSNKSKTLKLGEPSATRSLVPLDSSVSTLLLNEPISPLSSTPFSPPYYDISSNSEQPEIPDPSSPPLAQLQAITLSNQPPSIPDTPVPSSSEPQTEPPSKTQIEPSSAPQTEPPSEPPTKQPSEPPTETTHTSLEPINPSSEPEPTFLTLEESVALFSESSNMKLRTLSEQSILSDNPSEVRNQWNGLLRWMTSEVFKLKGLSKQVRNDYIREAGERIEARLARETEEKAHQEAEEKARLKAEELARR